MSKLPTRRNFLHRSSLLAGGAIAGLGDLGILGRLPRVSAQEAKPDPGAVRFHPDIEPLVRLLEDTPRERVLEAVAERIMKGNTTYRDVLAALLLAGIRNVQPRPTVGFKFHAVLVVNSAHLASMASPDNERWLPIFWAIDAFKSSQEADVREGDWTLSKVDEARVPPSHKARKAFIDAMDKWDVEAADVAVAALARSAPSNEIFDLFAHYGARDFRDIGHKAIFVSNSWRTLQNIGRQHAEPILRSLSYALLNHQGEPNPADSDLKPDRTWRSNEQRAGKLNDEWRGGAPYAEATREMLSALREQSSDEICEKAAQMLNRGVAPDSLFDAFLSASGELLMGQPGIVALHAMTSTNALRYAFVTCGDDHTRRKIILQNAAFVSLFRDAMGGPGKVGEARIDTFEPATKSDAPADAALEEIFSSISGDRGVASRKLLAYLDAGGDPKPFLDGARRLIFLKGTNAHDYKFSAAVLEDFHTLAPTWRNRYLASSVFNLRGSGDQDNALVERTRTAFGAG